MEHERFGYQCKKCDLFDHQMCMTGNVGVSVEHCDRCSALSRNQDVICRTCSVCHKCSDNEFCGGCRVCEGCAGLCPECGHCGDCIAQCQGCGLCWDCVISDLCECCGLCDDCKNKYLCRDCVRTYICARCSQCVCCASTSTRICGECIVEVTAHRRRGLLFVLLVARNDPTSVLHTVPIVMMRVLAVFL
jgi:hypothetical protein